MIKKAAPAARADHARSRAAATPGDQLRLARARSGLTQKDLARRLRCTQQAIAQAERTDSNPTVGFLQRWAKGCGKSLSLRFR